MIPVSSRVLSLIKHIGDGEDCSDGQQSSSGDAPAAEAGNHYGLLDLKDTLIYS